MTHCQARIQGDMSLTPEISNMFNSLSLSTFEFFCSLCLLDVDAIARQKSTGHQEDNPMEMRRERYTHSAAL